MSNNIGSDQRYKVPRNPCPICGGGDNMPRGAGKRCSGFTSSDGEYAHCSREELSGGLPIEAEGTYAHRLKGDCKCGTTHNPAPAPVIHLRLARPNIEKTYDYTDEAGDLLFQVVRFEGKTFSQRRPVGEKWAWHLSAKCKKKACPCQSAATLLTDVRRVPYHFGELLAADPGKPIVIAEGEKDVDRLRTLGAVATCNPGGAGKWKYVAEDMKAVCLGRTVYVIADPDEKGRPHAREVAESLIGVAAKIFVKEPPPPDDPRWGDRSPEKRKDVSDLLDAGMKWTDLAPLEWSGSETASSGDPPKTPRDPPGPPPGSPSPGGVTADHTDLRNAEHLVEWHGNVLRYIGTWEKWLAWDGARWALDDLGCANECAKRVARRLMAEARDKHKSAMGEYTMALAEGDPERKKRSADSLAYAEADLKHAQKSQGSGRLAAMIDVARTDPTVILHHDVLDADPMLLTVPNGTIDLRTGELLPHKQEHLITKSATIAFNPKATAPTWEAFLLQMMAGNLELVSFLQRAVGYSLTGKIQEHVLFFCYGTGNNGKSTFLGTIHSMLGEYANPAPRGLLFRSRNERHPTELANLHGRRFVTVPEIEDGQMFDEALTKDLTGGDPVSARRMREDFWSFLPTHKFWLAGNHRPVVRGDDEGIWRRMRLIPFVVTIPEDKVDKTLPDKLRAELPGILAWSVRGCLEWARDGLKAPLIVRDATAAYRAENDVLGQFFRERVRIDPVATIPRAELRSVYETWCREIGAEPVGAKRLAGRLRERAAAEGVVLGETTLKIKLDGRDFTVNAWKGVRFQTDAERTTAKPN